MENFGSQAMNEIISMNYLGLMGMSEMESAVKIMVEIAIGRKIPFHQVTVMVTDFIDFSKTSSQYAMVGFCHLCEKGWVESKYPNQSFAPNKALIQRVVDRFPLLDSVIVPDIEVTI